MKTVSNNWACPRCQGNDAYRAEKQNGQVGSLIDSSNNAVNPEFTWAIKADVTLCRNCGERMNFIEERKVVKTKEEKQNENFEIKLFLWIGIPLFIILLYFVITIDLSSVESL
jgi:hypothetical protein